MREVPGTEAVGMVRTTIFDLLLPHTFAGKRLSHVEVTALGHGGLCEEREVCR
ncbi:MAG: hypothetical protein K6U04_12170 [Armatimonadetes bacterium]|nr:hypothetical protein [Armatimonadota bacterium]